MCRRPANRCRSLDGTLVADGTPRCPPKGSMLRICRRLIEALDPRERRRGAILLVLMVLAAFAEAGGVASIMPFVGVLSRPEVVDTNRYLHFLFRVSGADSRQSFLVILGIAVFVALLASLAVKAIGLWALLRFAQNRSYTWGSRLVAGYLRKPYPWFLNRHSAELGNNVLSEVNQVVQGALLPALSAVASACVVVTLVALLMIIDPLLALAAAVFLGGLYGILSFSSRARLKRIGATRALANRARFRILTEALGGIKDVKVGSLEGHFAARFKTEARRLAESNIAVGVLGQIPSLGMQAILFGGMLAAVVYLLATYNEFERALPVVTVFAFAGYRLVPALQAIYLGYSQVRFSEAAVDLLCDHLSSMPQSSDIAIAPTSERRPLQQSLELKDLWYRYPGAPNSALKGINIRVPARAVVGLVGTTGSGKTTVVDVMLGLLPAERGSLLVDGVPIVGEDLASWGRSTGYVPQQIFLADESIAANIAFGVPADQIDHVAVEQAAKTANLHQFIVDELPNGYATKVGERGVRLSGGQRQRVGIARALYRNPDLLILDEATSALDSVTEEVVMDALQNLGGKKTIVLVAHRLTTVRRCDCIHLLDNGVLVASGTYAELLEENAKFRALASQLGADDAQRPA